MKRATRQRVSALVTGAPAGRATGLLLGRGRGPQAPRAGRATTGGHAHRAAGSGGDAEPERPTGRARTAPGGELEGRAGARSADLPPHAGPRVRRAAEATHGSPTPSERLPEVGRPPPCPSSPSGPRAQWSTEIRRAASGSGTRSVPGSGSDGRS